MDAEAQLDLLFDLLHDLGKYIRMPLSLLPDSAGEQEVRNALEQALMRTRSGSGEVHSARVIWETFISDSESGVTAFTCWIPLQSAVEDALSWGERLASQAPIARGEVMADFGRVPEAIRALIIEIRGDEG